MDICTYKFEMSKRPGARALNSLIDFLYALADKKVQVRVLLSIAGRRSGLSRLNQDTGLILQKRGIEVRYLPDNRCQHAKVLIVDKFCGIIGSHNWSVKSMTENFEVSVAIYHAGLLKEIQEHFEKIWKSSKLL